MSRTAKKLSARGQTWLDQFDEAAQSFGWACDQGSSEPMNFSTPSYRVLLRAGQIPNGFVVTKRTGDKPYTIHDTIMIYDPSEKEHRRESAPDKLTAPGGFRYLVAVEAAADVFGVNLVATETLLLCSVRFVASQTGIEIEKG